MSDHLQGPKIMAIIPAYNEEKSIASIIRRIEHRLPVLVVDDGSADQTVQRAGEAGAAVIRQIPNQGKGAALRAGFRQAIAQGCEAVICLDADGQHDPMELPHFVDLFIEAAPDLIIGQRDFKQMPPVRRLANSLGTALFSWAMGRPIADNQSGYRLVSRQLMEVLLTSQEHGFEFEVEMILTCIRQNMKIAWVPIKTIYGDERSHIQPIKHLVNFIRVSLKAYNARMQR